MKYQFSQYERMEKDKRYKTIKILIESGHITSFREVISYIPRSTICLDMGINYNRLARCLHNPRNFAMDDLLKLAAVLDITPIAVFNLMLYDCRAIKT